MPYICVCELSWSSQSAPAAAVHHMCRLQCMCIAVVSVLQEDHLCRDVCCYAHVQPAMHVHSSSECTPGGPLVQRCVCCESDMVWSVCAHCTLGVPSATQVGMTSVLYAHGVSVPPTRVCSRSTRYRCKVLLVCDMDAVIKHSCTLGGLSQLCCCCSHLSKRWVALQQCCLGAPESR